MKSTKDTKSKQSKSSIRQNGKRESPQKAVYKKIEPKTCSQQEYLDSIKQNDITFGIGVAGTGKTYIAMYMAIHYLLNNHIKKIILVRPAVEAGEKIGFLPGDIASKFDPYVRPLYDALYDMVDNERADALIANNIIEIAPLGFMRGRTLGNAFVILDEAQNTTPEQMKMFVTRLGENSKMIITGDVTQIDLPSYQKSGLIHAVDTLGNIQKIKVIKFQKEDVVRHPLVQEIVEAYEK